MELVVVIMFGDDLTENLKCQSPCKSKVFVLKEFKDGKNGDMAEKVSNELKKCIKNNKFTKDFKSKYVKKD